MKKNTRRSPETGRADRVHAAGREAEEETDKKKRKGIRPENRPMLVVAVIMSLLLLGMTAYFLKFMLLDRTETLVREQNNRYDNAGSRVVRGEIRTADGAVIARTTVDDTTGDDVREYPYGVLFAAVTGYSTMGRTNLESTYHKELMSSDLKFTKILQNDLLNRRSEGNNVVTTIVSDLQYYCWTLLGDYNGSITVVEPSTGKVLAMVSKPTYDPNSVKENWSELTSEDNTTGQLMNRSTQGLYSPGSTFKIVTAIEYLRENPDTYDDFHYTCTGSVTINGKTVRCEEVHGEVDLESAMAYSCNCAFVTMGMTLDRGAYAELCSELGFGTKLIDEISSSKSKVTVNSGTDDFEMMQTVFGQGNTMETPLQNVMITAMIANDGVMMKPYVVDRVENADGELLTQNEPQELNRLLTAEQVEVLNRLLTATIEYGTSPQAASAYCKVAGKSGTAQYSSSLDRTHAWFTAYAPVEEAELAVTVMLEQGGHGSPAAAPIASAIVDYWFSR